MGYYVTIRSISLKANGLLKLPENLDEIWRISEDQITLVETYFKWYDSFEEDLVFLARQGVTGSLVLTGEEGEYVKYIMKDGKVECYEGTVVYPEKPTIILQ